MIKTLRNILPTSLTIALTKWWVSGDKYECAICGFKASKYKDIGYDLPLYHQKRISTGGRRAGACYVCGSIDREHLIYTWLRDEFKLFERDRSLNILHVAPEVHLSQKILEHHFTNYTCGDLFTEGYTYPDYTINMDVTDMPFDDNKYDLIMCNHVLEHVPDDRKAMAELYRVLKPGGIAILQVPLALDESVTAEDFSIVDPKERERHYGQFDHVRLYGQDYFKRLEAAGFRLELVNISKQYPQYGLNPNEDIYICHK